MSVETFLKKVPTSELFPLSSSDVKKGGNIQLALGIRHFPFVSSSKSEGRARKEKGLTKKCRGRAGGRAVEEGRDG